MRVRLVSWLLLAVLCLVLVVAGSGTVAATEHSPPEWGNATAASPTEINVTFYDNGTINRTSITAADFSLSNGTVRNISTVETFYNGERGGAHVILILDERLNVDNVTVGFRDNGSISDTDDNELSSGDITVSGMDRLVPVYESFELRQQNASTVEIRLEANEPLSEIQLAITGPAEDELTRADFTAVDNETGIYTAEYTVSVEGSYSFVWERATDRYGNIRRMSRMEQFYYSDGSPDIVLDGPYSTPVDTPVNFSVANTVDEDGIEDVQWRIDGGTILSGESIQIAFASAGSHDIVVEVSDSEGNTAVTTREVQVRWTNTSATPVRLSRDNATHATASLDGTGFVQQLRAENGPLVESTNVSLGRLNAVFPASVTVSVQLRAENTVPNSLGTVGLGLFEIDHGDTPADRVTLQFGVNRTALNRTGTDPGNVTLYRNDSGWTPLDTTIVSRETDQIRYQSASPGLSQFAVGTNAGTNETNSSAANETVEDGAETDVETQADTTVPESDTQTQTGYPDITITNVSVNETEPGVGDTVILNVTATNYGTATGEYPITIELNNTTIGAHEITLRAGATRTESFEHELSQSGPLSVNGERVTNVSEERSLGSLVPGSLSGVLSGLPNPLALWPGGLVGTVLGIGIGAVVVVYGVLKTLAIYLGY